MVGTQTVVNRSVAETFQTSAFHTVVEQTVHNCLAELHLFYYLATRKIGLPIITVPTAMFINSEIERRSFENAEVEWYWTVSWKAIVGHRIKLKDELPP